MAKKKLVKPSIGHKEINTSIEQRKNFEFFSSWSNPRHLVSKWHYEIGSSVTTEWHMIDERVDLRYIGCLHLWLRGYLVDS